jgi:hypothetical protein
MVKVFFLPALDVVSLPQTAATKVNNRVEQYISRMIPRPGNLAVSLSVGGM